MTRVAPRALLSGAALAFVVACIDLGGPKDGVVSISNLRLPYPSVVVGGLMRDSLGNPSPLTITAYGLDGAALTTEPISYLALDPSVSVDADGTVHGVSLDTLGGRVVGGAGALQTPPQRVIVTIPPTTAIKSPDATNIEFLIDAPDTSATTNWSPLLTITLRGAGNAAAQGYVVTYSFVETPDAAVAGTPTAYIGDDAGRSMPRDTTGTTGVAARRVVLRQAAIAANIRDGSRRDTAIVRATVKFMGTDVPGSPVDFVIPIFRKP